MSDLRFVGELGVNSSCLPQGQGPEGCTHRAGVPFLTYLGTRTSNDKDFHLSSLTQPLLSPGGPGSMGWALPSAARTGISTPGISPALLTLRGFSTYPHTRHKARANLLMLFPSTRLMRLELSWGSSVWLIRRGTCSHLVLDPPLSQGRQQS